MLVYEQGNQLKSPEILLQILSMDDIVHTSEFEDPWHRSHNNVLIRRFLIVGDRYAVAVLIIDVSPIPFFDY